MSSTRLSASSSSARHSPRSADASASLESRPRSGQACMRRAGCQRVMPVCEPDGELESTYYPGSTPYFLLRTVTLRAIGRDASHGDGRLVRSTVRRRIATASPQYGSTEYELLIAPKRDKGIDHRSPSCRDEARQQPGRRQHCCHQSEDLRIARLHVEQHDRHELRDA